MNPSTILVEDIAVNDKASELIAMDNWFSFYVTRALDDERLDPPGSEEPQGP
jgi:hypothetical protein